MQICKNIKQARLAAKKTQAEMAKILNVKRTTYANWEHNTEPNWTIIKTIAGYLGIDFKEIVKETGAEIPDVNYTVSHSTERSISNLIESNSKLASVQLVIAEGNKRLIDMNAELTWMVRVLIKPAQQDLPVN